MSRLPVPFRTGPLASLSYLKWVKVLATAPQPQSAIDEEMKRIDRFGVLPQFIFRWVYFLFNI
jgi:hypothetical protein